MRGGPPPPPSAVQSCAPIFSALLPQRVNPPLQPSALHHPPLPKILAFSLQQDLPLLQPLSTCAPPPPLSISPQGRGEPPCIPSTVCTYVPLIYAFLIWKGVTLCHTSTDPDPLPQLSDLTLQLGVPPLKPLAVRNPPPPPLFVSLQGIGVSPLLPSAVRSYAPLLW